MGFPFQDIAHFGGVIFGVLAAITTWRALRRIPGRIDPALTVVAILLVLAIGRVTSLVRAAHAGG